MVYSKKCGVIGVKISVQYQVREMEGAMVVKKISVKKTAVKKQIKNVSASVKKASNKSTVGKKSAFKTVKKSTSGKQKPSTGKNSISVIEMSECSFVIVLGSVRLFFAIDEMRKLVSICHEAASEEQASVRLFSWFSMHRSDVLLDASIKMTKDPALMLIYRYLISHYSLKKD